MTPRLDPFAAGFAAMQPWIGLGNAFPIDGAAPLLKELLMMRVSPITGRPPCLHHHIFDTRDARNDGEAERSDHV